MTEAEKKVDAEAEKVALIENEISTLKENMKELSGTDLQQAKQDLEQTKADLRDAKNDLRDAKSDLRDAETRLRDAETRLHRANQDDKTIKRQEKRCLSLWEEENSDGDIAYSEDDFLMANPTFLQKQKEFKQIVHTKSGTKISTFQKLKDGEAYTAKLKIMTVNESI